MKEIYANRKVQGTLTQLTLRIDGRIVFLKASPEDMTNHKEIPALIASWEAKGAKVEFGKEWAKIDMFAEDKKLESLGGLIAENIDEVPTAKAERLIVDVFRKQLKKGNFALLVRDLGGKK